MRKSLQQLRELAASNATFFPITYERLDLLRHALDVEAEVVVDVLAWQGVTEGSHVEAGVGVAFPLCIYRLDIGIACAVGQGNLLLGSHTAQ